MTVGIAAIGENCGVGVLAADRMATLGNGMCVEEDEGKLIELLPNIVVACAFVHPEGDLVFEELRRIKKAGGTRLVDEVAKEIKQKFDAIRESKMNAYFKQNLGTDSAGFRELLTKANPGTALDYMRIQQAGPLGLEVLVVGFDPDAVRLFVATDTTFICFDARGYGVIGSGGTYGLATLIRQKHSKAASFAETLCTVYAAKKVAEVAPGVGQKTDIAIIQNGKTRVVRHEDSAMRVLEQVYDQLRPRSLLSEECQSICNAFEF